MIIKAPLVKRGTSKGTQTTGVLNKAINKAKRRERGNKYA